MFCGKCKFTSCDHLPKCPKCGFDWSKTRDELQLSWLQSAGYDWLQHAENLYQFHMEPAKPPDQTSDFSFEDPDSEADSVFADTQRTLLIEEIALPGTTSDPLKIQADTDVAKTPHSAEDDHEELTFPSQPVLESPPAIEHDETQKSIDAAPFPESETTDQNASEDVLAAWEIPDDMIVDEAYRNDDAGARGGERSAHDVDIQSLEQEEALPKADIEYDFLQAETKLATRDDANPDETQDAPFEQNKNSGQREDG